MKGIYLTEEGKKEIEAEIKRLAEMEDIKSVVNYQIQGDLYRLREILKHAILLPTEKSWDKAVPNGIEEDTIFDYIQDKFKQGVIIQPNPYK